MLWFRVWGLAGMQGAIALTWVIYNLYLPRLLSQFGFPAALAIILLVIENGLGMIMEPLMGGLSDRAQHWLGSRYPFIAVGVVVASALFISIPALVIFGSPTSVVRWVLLGAIVAWALAMTVFRSPALSLLGRYAVASDLPQAASILTLVGALVGAIGTLANQTILSWGEGITFTIGSIVLLAATLAMRFLDPSLQSSQPSQAPAQPVPLSWAKLGWIFAAGGGITLGFLLMRSLLSPGQGQSDSTRLLIFTIAHIITVLPAGWVAGRWGNRLAMVGGLVIVAISLLSIGLLPTSAAAVGLTAVLGGAFSLVANGTLPFALSLVPPPKAGLGTGLYFSGAGLAASLFGSGLARLGTIPVLVSAIGGAIAFLLAAGCVAIATQNQPTLTPNQS